MTLVYLIGEDECSNRFKIGVTTAKNIETVQLNLHKITQVIVFLFHPYITF